MPAKRKRNTNLAQKSRRPQGNHIRFRGFYSLEMILKPSFLSQFFILTKRQFRLGARNWSAYCYSVLFFIISIIIFKISVGNLPLSYGLANGVIFSSLCFMLMIASERLFYEDLKSGLVKQLIATGVDELSIICGYYAGFILSYLVLALGLVFIADLLLEIDLKNYAIQLCSICLCIINMGAVLVFARVILGLSKAGQLIIVLVAPFIIPCLIISIVSLQNPAYLLMSIGYFLSVVPFTIFVAKKAF
jgi:heme exporter protein CcmB